MTQNVSADDSWLFGWDPMPGIVSVWADRSGLALVWQRLNGEVRCTEERFRPWLFAASLLDLSHLGDALVETREDTPDTSQFSYRLLESNGDSFNYLISARDGRALSKEILKGAARRLGRKVESLKDLSLDYYPVGIVEQYLMLTGP